MSELLRRWRGLAPAALVLVLAAALLAPRPAWLGFASADEAPAGGVTATLDGLPPRPVVLVGFDPDLGTYAEVRPTVRAVLAALLQRDARLVFVSLTPEGRALSLAELDRLGRQEANPRRILDLGFVPGAEAALVRLAHGPIAARGDGALARAVRAEGAAAFDAALVLGGNDLGPRSWVEQFLPRVGEDLPLVAVVPTVLLPEVQPYIASGQLDALLGTPRDGAAYRASLELENLSRLADESGPSSVAVLLGLLIALGVLGEALVRRLLAAAREGRAREAA